MHFKNNRQNRHRKGSMKRPQTREVKGTNNNIQGPHKQTAYKITTLITSLILKHFFQNPKSFPLA